MALETEFDRLLTIIRANEQKVRELEAAQQVQLVRIAQIQQEINALKTSAIGDSDTSRGRPS